MTSHTVELKEWQSTFLKGVELPDNESRDTAEKLKEQGIIEVVELKDGISISSNSYVGRIKIGNMQINVMPKIKGMPLYQLLRYAYGLRELKFFNTAEHALDDFSFFDLLIFELYVEAEDLLYRGIQKSYIQKSEELASPRGQVNIKKLCIEGGIIKEKLPCTFFNRNINNILNKVLLAGLKLALNLVLDESLKIKLRRLCGELEEYIKDITITRGNLQLAKSSINRLTGRYYPVLEIINILYESQGIQLEKPSNSLNLRGYFFDMNTFFETLVGKLLKNCSGGYLIKDQFSLHNMFIYTPGFNPCRRKSPTPRPDFALMRNGKVVKLLDAKYRDLWERSLPREMLYQLGIYAASGIGDKTATILYPSINDIPSDQKIDINDPISTAKIASIILKPINLNKIAELLSRRENELVGYVDEIISGAT